jgi:hypothetical protein
VARQVAASSSVWLLLALILLAVAERRIATYSDWPGAELSVEDADAMKGERVFQGLLAIDDAKPPEVMLYRPGQAARHGSLTDSVFLLALHKGSSRSPPMIGEGQRIT